MINKLQIFKWNKISLCNCLSSCFSSSDGQWEWNNTGTVQYHLSSDFKDTLFLKFQRWLKFEIRRIWQKSLTWDLMCPQHFLFEKGIYYFSNFRNHQCLWRKQLDKPDAWHFLHCFFTCISILLICFFSPLHISPLRSYSLINSSDSSLLYSKKMQNHELIQKINNLMFSDISKIIFFQISTKQDYLWSCFLGEVSFSSSKSLERFLVYTLNTPMTLHDRKERVYLMWWFHQHPSLASHILSWFLT